MELKLIVMNRMVYHEQVSVLGLERALLHAAVPLTVSTYQLDGISALHPSNIGAP